MIEGCCGEKTAELYWSGSPIASKELSSGAYRQQRTTYPALPLAWINEIDKTAIVTAISAGCVRRREER
jgi:hypothetical protein